MGNAVLRGPGRQVPALSFWLAAGRRPQSPRGAQMAIAVASRPPMMKYHVP
jgi:hypothetical protein